MKWHAPHKKRKKMKNKPCRKGGVSLTKLLILTNMKHSYSDKKQINVRVEKGNYNDPLETFGSMDMDAFSRPAIGDKLIKKPTNYNNLSIINKGSSLNNILIPDGYYAVTLSAINKIKSTKENLIKDSLIYPILYNFRHYLELILKDSIRVYKLVNEEIGDNQLGYKDEHSLLSLWNELKPYIDDVESDDCKAFEKLINEMHNMDPRSFSFRYSYKGSKNPEDKCEPTFSNSIDIDIDNLEKVIKKMHYFMKEISSFAYHQLDSSREIHE